MRLRAGNDIPPNHMPPLPQNPDIMGTVTVGSDRQKPTSHASALRNWGFLPGAAEVGFFRSYPDRTPHDSRGRNWGRSELNRESDTPKGTGQLPACELVGWLKIEAQGCTEGPTAVHIRSTRKGVKPNPSFLSMGKGGFRVNLMNWGVSMTFRKVLCPHCRGKLETGQRIHPACIDGYADAQQAKKERADAKAARMAAKVERASIKARKEAIKTLADLKREAQTALNRWIVHVRDKDRPCISCGKFHNGAWHAGHYLSRGAAPQHALNPLNVWKQCAPCNTYLHGNQAAYRIRLVELIGADAVEALESDNTPRKWTREELTAIRDQYRAKLKEMKK